MEIIVDRLPDPRIYDRNRNRERRRAGTPDGPGRTSFYSVEGPQCAIIRQAAVGELEIGAKYLQREPESFPTLRR